MQEWTWRSTSGDFSFPVMTAQELEDFKKGRFLHWASYLVPGRQLDEVIREAVARGVYLNPTLVYEWVL